MLIFQQWGSFVKDIIVTPVSLSFTPGPAIMPGATVHFGHTCREAILSEFYKLRRTTIKDVTGFCGFLAGFLGSAPLAWRYLGAQLEGDDFVRGLWLFFGIVLASAVSAGAAGLGVGFLLGGMWERYHRHRRSRRRKRADALSGKPSRLMNVTAGGEPPRSALPLPDGSGQQPPQLRIVRGRRRSGP